MTAAPIAQVTEAGITSSHHPFTAPGRTDFDPSDPEQLLTLKSRAYDLVVNGEERLYSQKLACTECGTSVPQLEPRSFSFNSPYGACEVCHGLGNQWSFDPAKVIADPSKPLLDGGLGPGANSWHMQQRLEELARKNRVNLKLVFEDMPKKGRDAMLEGIRVVSSR